MTSPRTEIVIGDTTAQFPNGDGKTLVGGLIISEQIAPSMIDSHSGHWMHTTRNTQQTSQRLWKLLLGAPDKFYRIDQDVLTGPEWPNTSFPPLVPLAHSRECGRTAERGCLFELTSDPLEVNSLASSEPSRFASMLARVDQLQATVFSPVRGKKDPGACTEAESPTRGGFWGPWVDEL